MAQPARTKPLVLVFDAEARKCSVNGGVWVYFKGCITEGRFNEIIDTLKRRDKEKPPEPEPDDRDGYWVCKNGTWHFCTTYPPYACFNSGGPC
jgi:hypothetical protein